MSDEPMDKDEMIDYNETHRRKKKVT